MSSVRENTILNDQLSPWALPEFPLGMKWDKEKMHALISCMMHVRDVLLAIRGNYDKAYNGDLFIVVCSRAWNRLYLPACMPQFGQHRAVHCKIAVANVIQTVGGAVVKDIDFGSVYWLRTCNVEMWSACCLMGNASHRSLTWQPTLNTSHASHRDSAYQPAYNSCQTGSLVRLGRHSDDATWLW